MRNDAEVQNRARARHAALVDARLLRRALLAVAVMLLALLPAAILAQEAPPEPRRPGLGLARATVFLMQVYDYRGERFTSCVGSGTLVSSDGLILTNAHNAQASRRCRADAIVVALTIREDEPPVPTYFAEVVESAPGLDLAVLRIARHLDGRTVLRDTLQLPFVELGDSDTLPLGEPILVVGYPDIGQDPVEARVGAVSAFMAEASVGARAWIKTDASIPGTMSGGGAYDRVGRLVGVPTVAPAGAGAQTIDCRAVQDTNLDGLIDANDTCIPLGGFINALRPARLARPLVRAAQLGIRPPAPPSALAPAGQPAFSRLFLAPSIDQAGQPTTVLAQAPSGTRELYLFWDYENMAEGAVYELRTTVNSVPDARLSLAPVVWSGGESGLWYLGITDLILPDGAYEFLLFIEGQPAGSARINVGGAAPAVGSFTDMVFGVEAGGTLMGSGHVLPSGINVMNARFVYQNMVLDTPWAEVWYYQGAPLYRNDAAWTDGANGVKTLRVSSDQGIPPGRYRLELVIGGRLAATGDLIVAGGAVGPKPTIFGPITFADSISPAGAPAGVVGAGGNAGFPTGAERLYAFFDFQNLAPGIPWTQRWSIDNDTLFTITQPWRGEGNGQNGSVSLEGLPRLPDGAYRLELLVGNESLQTAAAVVGTGVNNIRTARASGVQMTGAIVDAETGRGIPGAQFTLLRAEFSVEDFTWDQAQVLATSVADESGYFEIPVRLPLDEYYSVVIRAGGYLPINADAILIDFNTPDPLSMRVEMNKD